LAARLASLRRSHRSAHRTSDPNNETHGFRNPMRRRIGYRIRRQT
jgi:hypothetical protein